MRQTSEVIISYERIHKCIFVGKDTYRTITLTRDFFICISTNDKKYLNISKTIVVSATQVIFENKKAIVYNIYLS